MEKEKMFVLLDFFVLKGLRGEIAICGRILSDLEAILVPKTAPEIKRNDADL